MSYQVTVEPVANFRAGFDGSSWSPIWEDFHCDWCELWFNQRIEPPSWVVGDKAIAAGGKGILFRSRFHEGGTNLVIFPDALGLTDALTVFGPVRQCRKTRIRGRSVGPEKGQRLA